MWFLLAQHSLVPLNLQIFPNPATLADAVASHVAEWAKETSAQKNRLVAWPAGKTPTLFYQQLATRYQPSDWEGVTVHFLDEYLGIAPEHPACFHVFAKRVAGLLSLDRSRVRVFNTDAPVAHREAGFFEKEMSRSGLDLSILGIGSDGHIAFNMPGTPFDAPTRIVDISESTRRANAGDFGGDWTSVPEQAVTMGIGTIVQAKKILLLATGEGKASIVRQMLEGPITEDVPASALRLHLEKTMFFLDEAAASLLSKTTKASRAPQ